MRREERDDKSRGVCGEAHCILEYIIPYSSLEETGDIDDEDREKD